MEIAPLSGPLGAEVWRLDQNPLAEMLAARFPGVRMFRGDARALMRVLERNQVGPVKAVGSSLPLLNLSAREQRAACFYCSSFSGSPTKRRAAAPTVAPWITTEKTTTT